MRSWSPWALPVALCNWTLSQSRETPENQKWTGWGWWPRCEEKLRKIGTETYQVVVLYFFWMKTEVDFFMKGLKILYTDVQMQYYTISTYIYPAGNWHIPSQQVLLKMIFLPRVGYVRAYYFRLQIWPFLVSMSNFRGACACFTNSKSEPTRSFRQKLPSPSFFGTTFSDQDQNSIC